MRVCKCCNVIDDEVHFLIHCKLHIEGREKMFRDISDTCSKFSQLSDRAKMYYLLNIEGNLLISVSKFCEEAFAKRANTLD